MNGIFQNTDTIFRIEHVNIVATKIFETERV